METKTSDLLAQSSAQALHQPVRLRFDRGTLLIEGAPAPAGSGLDERPLWLPSACVFDGRVGAYRAFASTPRYRCA